MWIKGIRLYSSGDILWIISVDAEKFREAVRKDKNVFLWVNLCTGTVIVTK